MPTREEIREVLIKEADYLYGLKPEKNKATRRAFIECIIDLELKYLHQAGYVLKAKRKRTFCTFLRFLFLGERETDYTAWEPLIEESE